MRAPPSERRLLLLIALVVFANVLDFVMVLPLGPDFADALGIPTSKLGLVGASYTLAAAASGVVGALVLDRFDRRKALGVALFGLAAGTAAGGLAAGAGSMLAARVLAGAFGGPTTSLALAIVADAVPAERRGRAMGVVMGGFSLASVLGVPAGLELARTLGWRSPFFAVAALVVTLAATALAVLPPGGVRAPARAEVGARVLLRRPTVRLSLAATAALMTAHFSLVQNVRAYWELNLGYPRERFGLLFAAGGAVSFATMRLAGRLADRFGPTAVAAAATICYEAVLLAAFVRPSRAVPALLLFVAFMVTSTFRAVPMQALSSRVPGPDERARFMSAQSVVQYLASAVGALVSSSLLSELPGGGLAGMATVAALAAVLAAAVPALLFAVEARVRRAEQDVRAGGSAPRARVASQAASSAARAGRPPASGSPLPIRSPGAPDAQLSRGDPASR